MEAELGEGSLVDQEIEALTGRELLGLVLAGGLLFTTAQPGALAALMEVVDQLAQRRARYELIGCGSVGRGHWE